MIYLDHAAATPVCKEALEAMMPYFAEEFFNPSSAYLPAKKVSADYEQAKAEIGHAVGAKGADIIITAGATEANNLAFTSLVARARVLSESNQNFMLPRKQISATRARVLYLVTEHDSVRRVAERFGGVAIAVDKNGRVDLDDLKAKITDDTELISISLANNELGTIQPMAEVAEIVRAVRLERWRRGIKKQLLLHSDASQALNLLDVSVARLGVDLLTLNSAKVYGPKGVGALYVGHGVRLSPLTVGGGQENGLRSGTENVPSVVGFATALTRAKKHINGNRKKYAKMKQILLDELQGYELINRRHALDNFIVLCYNGIDAERLIYLLEESGVYVATGAACAASKGVRSHVLTAMGLSEAQIAGSLRLTLGETNTVEQMHEVVRIINKVVSDEYRRVKNERV